MEELSDAGSIPACSNKKPLLAVFFCWGRRGIEREDLDSKNRENDPVGHSSPNKA